MGPFQVFPSSIPTGSVTLFLGDFLAATPALLGTFSAVWDRGGVAAVEPSQLAPYVSVLATLCTPFCRLLVEVTDIESRSTPAHVPRHNSKDAIVAAFSQVGFQAEVLQGCPLHLFMGA